MASACGFRVTMAAAMLGVMASPAYAYLDPGTGSMILQVLLGGVAGLALAGKLYWHKLLSLFGLRKDSDTRPIEDREHTIDSSR
jgi:hypothetical protein